MSHDELARVGHAQRVCDWPDNAGTARDARRAYTTQQPSSHMSADASEADWLRWHSPALLLVDVLPTRAHLQR